MRKSPEKTMEIQKTKDYIHEEDSQKLQNLALELKNIQLQILKELNKKEFIRTI